MIPVVLFLELIRDLFENYFKNCINQLCIL